MEREEALKAALGPGAGCLSLEDLGRYADGMLPAPRQAEAESHVRGCLHCQAELALFEAVTAPGIRAEEADLVREGVARLEHRRPEIVGVAGAPVAARRRWLGLAPLATVAAVVVVVAGLSLRRGQPPDLPGGVTTTGEVTRSLAVTVREPVGDLKQAPSRFAWLAVPQALRYRVRLMEVDRHEVWTASTPSLEVELPPSVRVSLAPGRTLVWDVTAYDGTGAVIADSGVQSFRVVLP
jgi:hypothetical protein